MIINLLACVGLMFILKYGTILNSYRKFVTNLHPKIAELHKCSLCLGFWTGVIIGVADHLLNNTSYYFLPLASSALCWFVDNLNNMIQSVEIKIDKDLDL